MAEARGRAQDAVIVGGGVIGLSIAYALCREGLAVTVLDRAALGRAASWAGAGILAPAADRPPRHPLAALAALSARLYPDWSAALLEETGIDNGYRRSGGVDVGWTDREDEELRTLAGRWRAEGIACERLAPADILQVEPALNPSIRVAYFVPDRAQIRNPRHVRALAEAARRRGAHLRPGLPALGFRTDSGRVIAVETPEGSFPCSRAIVAAGPWSAGLLEPLGLTVPTPPIKGQIVLLHTDPPRLSRIIEHGKSYLVPRDDGRILVGSTEEDAGFDTRSTPWAVRDLLSEALHLCPTLADAAVEASWAGLRPGSLDSRPYLGPAPGYPNLLIATGHRRAGLQTSPATAELVADLVLGRPPHLDPTAFRIDRAPTPADEDEELFRS